MAIQMLLVLKVTQGVENWSGEWEGIVWISDPLRKHAYSNILKILPPKNENFQIKILIFFHISAQNIDCGYSSTHNLCFEQK